MNSGFIYDKRTFLTILRRRGIADRNVLAAMEAVPREHFVDMGMKGFAYEDSPLPIGEGQTISQPYIVALMAEALLLTKEARVLEIGTGSGYAAAILSRLVNRVYTVERLEGLVQQSRRRLQQLQYDNVEVLHGDGTLGWPEKAPYDAIVVTAGGPEAPPALIEQLRPGGRLVIPVGADGESQRLLRLTRSDDGTVKEEELAAVRFVPLIGAQGWPDVQ